MVEINIIVIHGWIKWEVMNNLVIKEFQQLQEMVQILK